MYSSVCQGILEFEISEFSTSLWSFRTSVQTGMRTKPSLSFPGLSNESESSLKQCGTSDWQVMAIFLSLFHQLDPGTEVTYLHRVLCTLLLSIWMSRDLGAFSFLHSSFLSLLPLLALFKLEFITR